MIRVVNHDGFSVDTDGSSVIGVQAECIDPVFLDEQGACGAEGVRLTRLGDGDVRVVMTIAAFSEEIELGDHECLFCRDVRVSFGKGDKGVGLSEVGNSAERGGCDDLPDGQAFHANAVSQGLCTGFPL